MSRPLFTYTHVPRIRGQNVRNSFEIEDLTSVNAFNDTFVFLNMFSRFVVRASISGFQTTVFISVYFFNRRLKMFPRGRSSVTTVRRQIFWIDITMCLQRTSVEPFTNCCKNITNPKTTMVLLWSYRRFTRRHVGKNFVSNSVVFFLLTKTTRTTENTDGRT